VRRYSALASSALIACASRSTPPAPTPAAATPAAPEVSVADDGQEQARRDELAAAHRKLEGEQAAALAATCSDADRAKDDKHERCLPSCYPTEPADPRARAKLAGTVEITHLVCEVPAGRFVIADEIDAGKLTARAVRGRYPAPHKKTTWQAELESALHEQHKPARGELMIVAGGWRTVEHPITKERLRCVTVAHYARVRRGIDACGGTGAFGCEAGGDAAARGINVVHYRLAEARRLQAAGKRAECQQAALEAVAVARGMPRWRQYMQLDAGTGHGRWTAYVAYRTRFDGTLDEDTLFATAAALGVEAETVYTTCGGPTGAPTTAAQEQSFHTCW